MRLLKNKKAQFGPDVLVGVLLIAVLGLGGVFFLNLFVNSLALNGLLGVIDSEVDQKCFFMLLPLSGDDYIREGISQERITEISNPESNKLQSMKNHFNDFSRYENRSKEFDSTIKDYQDALDDNSVYSSVAKDVAVQGFMSSPEQAKFIREKEINTPAHYSGCSIPVYNPYGNPGIAEFYIRVRE